MENIKGILITDLKVKRLLDDKVFTCIIPDPEIGYYSSMMKLKSLGYKIENFIEKNLADLNPTRFQYIND